MKVLFSCSYLHYCSFLLIFTAPIVLLATEVPTYGGVTTISGNNFGSNSAFISVSVGDVSCTNVAIVQNDDQISCNLPPGTGNGKHIKVVAGNQTNLDTNTAGSYSGIVIRLNSLINFNFNLLIFTFTVPIVKNITNISTRGGSINIYGNNFGNDPQKIQIAIGTVVCTLPHLVTPHTILTCLLPPGTGE
jgi:hypothetical protein